MPCDTTTSKQGSSTSKASLAAKLTDADDVELEPSLQQLALDLRCDAIEADMALGVDGGRAHGRHFFINAAA